LATEQPNWLQNQGHSKESTGQKVQDVNDLMQRLIDVWAGVEQSVIDDAADQQCRRLHAGLRAIEYSECLEYSL